MCYDLIMLWLTLVYCQQLAEPPPVFYQAPAFDDVVSWLQAAGAMSCVGGQLPLHGGLCLALGSGATTSRLPYGTTLLTWLILWHSKAQWWNRVLRMSVWSSSCGQDLWLWPVTVGLWFLFCIGFFVKLLSHFSVEWCVSLTSFFSLWSWLCTYCILCKWLMSLCGKNNKSINTLDFF